MLSLAECKSDLGIVAVSKVAPTSPSFVLKVNDACRRLMDYGNWWSTVIKANVAVYDRCVTWPRWVGTVLYLNACGQEVKLRTSWYDFLPLNGEDYERIAHWAKLNHHFGVPTAITDVGTSPVFNNVPANAAYYIIAFARGSADYKGKTLTIWGVDANGWPASETLAFKTPYAVSTRTYQKITRVLKTVTSDYVDVYSCASATPGDLLDMAHYEPGETEAQYRVSYLPQCPSQARGLRVSAMIKRRHIDAVADSDLVSINNRAAIKLMMLAAEKENASDPQGAEAESTRAIHELNRELENNLPFIQTPIRYHSMCGVNLSRYSSV